MKISAVILLAAFSLTLHAEPDPNSPRGQCYETVNCDNRNHASMLLPLELCAGVLKRSGEKMGSWKQLGSKVCVSFETDNAQN